MSDFAIIGEVTDTQHMVLEFDGEVVCDIPLGPLAADAPEYDRPYLSKEDYTAWAGIAPMRERPDTDDVGGDVMKLLASPNLSSRRWIAEQYDSQVGADTLQTGGDAGVDWSTRSSAPQSASIPPTRPTASRNG